MQRIDGCNFKDIKLKRSDKCVPLLAVISKIVIDKEIVPIDPLLLFQRISIVKSSDEELEEFLQYELAPFPLSLFDESGMRKNVKSQLYSIFTPSPSNTLNTLNNGTFVIDGGMLLHRVPWKINEKFASICHTYVLYVRRNYKENVIVVFDGYNFKSTKSAERNRRNRKQKCADIFFNENIPITVAQEKFLSNENNKTSFIKLLSQELKNNNITVIEAPDDADTIIVQTALSQTASPVLIVSEDIDVLVILAALCPIEKVVYFIKPGKGKTETSIYSSTDMLQSYPQSKKYILFLHAFTGCDTTSAFFNHGKNTFIKKFENNKTLHIMADIFYKKNSSNEDIFDAGEQCTLILYGASKSDNNLNKYRYKCFVRGVCKRRKMSLAFLPPTDDAARQHFKRVYFQVQQWLGEGETLSANDWGWIEKDYLHPISMTKSPAPEKLLRTLFCSCKSGCENNCGCKKTGLYCSNACLTCSGVDCLNTPIIDDFIETSSTDTVDDVPEAEEATF
ncbi:hypothetical protein ALC62_15994 [Cyphomyrmex costatus]|uniref:Tesmin/TSO1-like CXC domain-containing protein n=1 Tax=Cyphomyrmex costatus TaxID=456900 RepID=A0A151I678_9HYME|nr:hypothetical protein ALC62_15994 [Cyphomyrmex costatus]